jgi:hypothetical protein
MDDVIITGDRIEYVKLKEYAEDHDEIAAELRRNDERQTTGKCIVCGNQFADNDGNLQLWVHRVNETFVWCEYQGSEACRTRGAQRFKQLMICKYRVIIGPHAPVGWYIARGANTHDIRRYGVEVDLIERIRVVGT